MNFDKNTVVGFILLGILLIGFFIYTDKEQAKIMQARSLEKQKQDSVNRLNTRKLDTVIVDKTATNKAVNNSNTLSSQTVQNYSEIVDTILENNLFRIAFTNKGGQIKWVELKNYKLIRGGLVRLMESDINKIYYNVPLIEGNQENSITEFVFNKAEVKKGKDGTQTVKFILPIKGAGSIEHIYTLQPNDYMISVRIQSNNEKAKILSNNIQLQWTYQVKKLEKDLKWEKGQSNISYLVEGDYDFERISGTDSMSFTSPVNWIGIKQQFFNASLIGNPAFSSAKVKWISGREEDTSIIFTSHTSFTHQFASNQNPHIDFSLYLGPNDYNILKKYNQQLENLVDLGSGIWAFVKYINLWIILPVFNFLKGFIENYGLIIFLLTLFIRLVTSPLTYKSYLSGAKMKVLRPEIAELKEKYKNDQQQISVAQMKLFREAGVNPLGGCIPALLQIPIFFALYSFFNSSLLLRGKSFLWAEDLSAYDAIITFNSFSIPFMGSHISLFTLTAAITSLLISVYGMSLTADQSNPMMKYMPYIIPVFLIFIFNRMPSALTWYYTVSNVVTLGLQYVIQNHIIDHDKILSKIQENKKKPKKKSKWQERVEQMQKSQAKIKEMKNRNRR